MQVAFLFAANMVLREQQDVIPTQWKLKEVVEACLHKAVFNHCLTPPQQFQAVATVLAVATRFWNALHALIPPGKTIDALTPAQREAMTRSVDTGTSSRTIKSKAKLLAVQQTLTNGAYDPNQLHHSGTRAGSASPSVG